MNRSRLSNLVLLVGAMALSACGSHSTTPDPPPPPVGAPSIQCPADQTANATGSSTVVVYPAPTASGGTAPLATSCTIPSGATFPIGKSDVICTTTDAASRQASCVFHVNVTSQPKLKGTAFLAFGDSITGGEVAAPNSLLDYRPDLSYPTVLTQLLTQRYSSQPIAMTNCGQYGQLATQDTDRFKSVLAGGSCGPPIPARFRTLAAGLFDAVLLLEGTNDLNSSISDSSIIPKVIDALKTDIRNAKGAGVQQVFLSTVPPEFVLGGDLVPALNDAIRSLAASENVILVDSYAALGGSTSTLVGVGGIHPTAMGYQVMAQAFFTAISANFEVPAPASPASRRIR